MNLLIWRPLFHKHAACTQGGEEAPWGSCSWLAARAALLWAQNYVDQDWELWNSQDQP